MFEAVMWVKSMHLMKSCFKPEKKEKIWKYKMFLHKSQSKRLFSHRIHSMLRRADSRGSADIIYRI